MGNGIVWNETDSADQKCITAENKVVGFRAQDLRAPIFSKHGSKQIDSRVYHKYCNEEIIKSWFKIVDVNGSGDITFEEYRKSLLANKVTEETARQIFSSMDVDGNNLDDFQEFRSYHLIAGLPTLDYWYFILTQKNLSQKFIPKFRRAI